MYLDLLLLSSVAPVVMITVLCARINSPLSSSMPQISREREGNEDEKMSSGLFCIIFWGILKFSPFYFFFLPEAFFVKERIEVLTRSISRPFGGRLKPIVTTPYPEKS